jgi:PAS domain S-box-containing protein
LGVVGVTGVTGGTRNLETNYLQVMTQLTGLSKVLLKTGQLLNNKLCLCRGTFVMDKSSSLFIETGSGSVSGDNAYSSGAEAARQACATISTFQVSAVLVFVSVVHDLREVLRGIRSQIPDAPLFGATTAGEILAGPLQGSVVVTVLASPHLKVSCGLGRDVSLDWQKALDDAVSAPGLVPYFTNPAFWNELTLSGTSAFAVLFSPGNTRTHISKSNDILRSLTQKSLGLLPVFGGSVADDWRLDSNFVLLGDEVYCDSMVLAIFESQLQYGIAMAHGFIPAGAQIRVTEAEGNEITELDGEPAADVYARLTGFSREELEGRHLSMTTGYTFGTADLMGQYNINVATFLTPDGGIRVMQSCAPGTILTVMGVTPGTVISAGQNALSKAIIRGGITDPACALVAYCALRPRIVGSDNSFRELEIMAESLSGRMTGFFSFGEQGLTDCGVNVHNNAVISVLVFGNDLSPAAAVALENIKLQVKLEEQRQQLLAVKLQESEQRFHKLFEQIPNIAVQGYDRERRVIFWNQASEVLYGYSCKEALGRKLEELIIPDAMKIPVVDAVTAWVEGGAPIPAGELALQHKNGKTVYVFSSHVMQVNGSGEPEMYCIDVDLADRKKSEDELEKNAAYLWALIESFDGMIYICTPDYRIEFMNDRLIQRTGRDATGELCYKALHELDSPCSWCVNERVFAGEIVTWEVQSPKDDRWYHITNTPVNKPDGTVSKQAMITDVTAQKVLAEHLMQAQKVETIGQLAGGLAHDFNNILSVIGGYGSLMEMTTTLNEEQKKMLKIILEASGRAAELTNSLLAYSRKQVMDPHNADLNQVVTDVVKFLDRIIHENILLTINLSCTPLVTHIDSGQIEQVLINFATNARDAMPSGGSLFLKTEPVVIDMASALNGYALPGRYALLTVTDTGTGIGELIVDKVFDPFFTTKEVGKGTGLGLAMVLGIVKQHNGYISVESTSGTGTTFRVYLPLVESKIEADSLEQAAGRELAAGTETILVVEDEAVVRDLMKTILEIFGYTVICAEDGRDAMQKYTDYQSEIKLVIMDMVMPHMGGKEAYEAIKRINPAAPALFCSGHAADIICCLGELGENAEFIKKPVAPNTLLRKVRELLDK